MKQRIFLIIFFFGSVLLIGYLLKQRQLASDNQQYIYQTQAIDKLISENNFIHKNFLFDGQDFLKSINQVDINQKSLNYKIFGGIIPHHLLPGNIIADFFYKLSLQKPETIFLLGPNHYERGEYKALTSTGIWNTEFGDVKPAMTIINKLIDNKLIRSDEAVLNNEHSIYGIMPFIKYYLPQVNVVPIILSNQMQMDEINTLTDELTNLISSKTVVVAAIDFSHYLTSDQAKLNDQVTLNLIKKYDYPRIYALDNGYTDASKTMVTFLKIMEKTGNTDLDIVNHTNSGEILNRQEEIVTSYFEMIFY